MSEWISVKDQLPEHDGFMLLLMLPDGYDLGYYGRYGAGRWTNTLGTEQFHPTHWMPLPKPPEKEK